jgi:hypothetical protein
MPKWVSMTDGRSSTVQKAVFEFARTVFLLMSIAIGVLAVRFVLLGIHGLPH